MTLWAVKWISKMQIVTALSGYFKTKTLKFWETYSCGVDQKAEIVMCLDYLESAANAHMWGFFFPMDLCQDSCFYLFISS